MRTLQILEEPSQTQVLYGLDGPATELWSDDLGAVNHLLQDLTSQLGGHRWSPSRQALPLLRRLGALLAQCSPATLTRWLREAGPELRLEVLGDRPRIPWELLELDGQPLWRRLRIVRGAAGSPRAPVRGRSRALLITDPEGLTPWARHEARLIESVLQYHMQVDRWEAREVTQTKLLEALTAGAYSLLHWCGFVHYQEDDPWQSRLLLSGGGLTAGLVKALHCPALMVLTLHPVGHRHPVECASLWAQAWAQAGVRFVVANQWEPAPDVSRYVLAAFYAHLMAGCGAGLALQRAREETFVGRTSDPRCSLESFLGHGDGSLTLGAPQLGPTRSSEMKPTFRLLVTHGPDQGREIPLYIRSLEMKGGVTLGGRGLRPGDVELDDPDLSGPAATLDWEAGQLWLASLGPALQINGLPVMRRMALTGGEELCLGSSRLSFEVLVGQAAGAVRPFSPEPTWLLECIAGGTEDLGQQVELTGRLSLVGRSPECRLRLHDPSVSRHQFSLVLRDGGVVIQHLGQNPTVVNGVAIDEQRELRVGDLIELGGQILLRLAQGAA